MNRTVIALTLAFVLPGCAADQVCGDGTHAEGSDCVASLSPSCGPGTKLVEGNCVPDSGGGAQCGTGTHSENGTCIPDVQLSGNAARFYDAHLTDPPEFVPIADAAFHESFLSGENLVFIGAYLPNSSTLRLYGGGGTQNPDGTYTLDHAHAYDTPANVTAGVMQTMPFTFQMKVFGAPQNIVLVDTVISEGAMETPEGFTIVQSGKLMGVLTPDNAKNVYIMDANLNLFDLINSLQIAPNVDHDGNGVKESWYFGMTFSTIPVWLF